ncbi:MAG: pectate lyase [Bacteroidales bacterium]|nr:pectate lyase [Bacteroidales bacterium]
MKQSIRIPLFILTSFLFNTVIQAVNPVSIPGDVLYEHIGASSGCRLHEFPLFDYAEGENGYILFDVVPTVTDTFVFTANIGTGSEADRFCSLGPVDANRNYVSGVVEKLIPAGSGSNWQANSADYEWRYFMEAGVQQTFKVSYRKNGQRYGVNLYTICVHSAQRLSKSILAFPGAEGSGRYTTGGRGGKVYRVKNLNDSGPGSLREAVEAAGTRTVVFDVAGIIALQSPLSVDNGNITIAGQTAPGDGICLKNYPFVIKGNNVIVRFIRSRMGDEANYEGDAAEGRYSKHIIIDHCSFSWSVDECASFYSNEHFTMQWCMINESMNISVHSKVAHGYGGLWGGRPASFHHNLISNHQSRTPRFTGGDPMTERVDYRNNVVYNWGPSLGTYGGTGGVYNFVGNYYKPGPATALKPAIASRLIYTGPSDDSTHYWGHFYFQDNYFDATCSVLNNAARLACQQVNANNVNGLHLATHEYLPEGRINGILASNAYAVEPVTTHAASVAYQKVLALAGASHSRDALDLRYTEEVRLGIHTYTGSLGGMPGIIDTQNDAGAWPEYRSTAEQRAALTDSDGDGIPDVNEIQLGLNPHLADGHLCDLDADYTNLEVYMNALVQDIMQEGLDGGLTDLLPSVGREVLFALQVDRQAGYLYTPDAVSMQLFSMDGNLLRKGDQNGVSFIGLSKGIYLIAIYAEDGQRCLQKIAF